MAVQFNLSWTLPITPAAHSIGNRTDEPPVNASDSWKFKESPMFHFLINVLATMETEPPSVATTPYSINTTAHQTYMIGGLPPAPTSNATVVVGYSAWEISFIYIAGMILSLLTAGMNLMVMVSFKVDRQLQTISNYFLFSLAVADFTIGLISIPLMTIYTAAGEWNLGYPLCQFWLCIDYLMCNASVYNLLLISFDRYFSVTRPLTYRPRRTMKKALVMIASTYIISLILWPPWIISWPYIEGQFVVGDNACMVQFLVTNPYVTIGTIIAAFYLPVTIMIVLYARVFWETKKRQQEFGKLQACNQRSQYRTANVGSKQASTGCNTPNKSQPVSRKTSSTVKDGSNSVVIQNAGVTHPLLINRQSSTSRMKYQDRISEAGESACSSPTDGRSRLKSWLSKFFATASRNRGRQSSMHSSTAAELEEGSFSSESCDSPDVRTGKLSYRESSVGVAGNTETSMSCSVKSLKSRGSKKQSQLMNAAESVPMLPDKAGSRVYRRAISNQCNNVDGLSTNDPSTYTVLIRLEDSDGKQRKISAANPSEHQGGTKVTVFENEQAKETEFNSGSASKLPDSLALPGGNTAKVPITRQRSHSDTISMKETELQDLRKQFEESSRKTSPNLLTRSRPGSVRVPYSVKNAVLNSAGGIVGKKKNQKHKHHKKKGRQEKKQESKAAKTLSAILLAFILTWTPYSIIIVIEAFRPYTVPVFLWNLSYYLCYINSTVNPLCYALCNATFRGSYIRILTCKWRNPRSTAGHSRFTAGAPSGFITR